MGEGVVEVGGGYFKMWILIDLFFLSLPKIKYLNFEIVIGGLRIEIVVLARGGGGWDGETVPMIDKSKTNLVYVSAKSLSNILEYLKTDMICLLKSKTKYFKIVLIPANCLQITM